MSLGDESSPLLHAGGQVDQGQHRLVQPVRINVLYKSEEKKDTACSLWFIMVFFLMLQSALQEGMLTRTLQSLHSHCYSSKKVNQELVF